MHIIIRRNKWDDRINASFIDWSGDFQVEQGKGNLQ